MILPTSSRSWSISVKSPTPLWTMPIVIGAPPEPCPMINTFFGERTSVSSSPLNREKSCPWTGTTMMSSRPQWLPRRTKPRIFSRPPLTRTLILTRSGSPLSNYLKRAGLADSHL